MKIELFPYERHVLETLETAFGIERETVVGFARSLSALRQLFQTVIGGPEDEFRGGRVVIMGLINHAHHLLAGGLQALQAGNGVVWSGCVRGLIETFGASILISEKPGTVITHLEQVSPKRLYDAAERGSPGLGRDAKRLHQIVHPASGAIFAGFTVADGKDRTANFRLGLRQLKQDEGLEGVTVLANLAALLENKLTALANDPGVLRAGKRIMIRTTET